MVYLDYAANTPANEAVLETFCETERNFPANPSSPHPLGQEAGKRLEKASQEIAHMLQVKESELIYTSGASESNNLAIKGVAHQYQSRGHHIISTWLEHSSVNGALAALSKEGFEIDYVRVTKQGQVDLENLRSLLREDTILVSICMVDSEVGLQQPIKEIYQILQDYPHCLLHVDAAQAAGKLPVSLEYADLLTLAPHKFYGLNGSGLLLRKDSVLLTPLIDGGMSTTPFRSGTPVLSHITAMETALRQAERKREAWMISVEKLNHKLREALCNFSEVLINSTTFSIPYIFNLSVPGVRAEKMQKMLAERGICLSTKSACCAPGTVSRPVFALTGDRKRALSTLRVSLSHLTSENEVDLFLEAISDCRKQWRSH